MKPLLECAGTLAVGMILGSLYHPHWEFLVGEFVGMALLLLTWRYVWHQKSLWND